MTTVGSLCTGVGGLEMATELVFGPLKHTWHAENDRDASAVLEANWPGTPNLGDITEIDFTAVEPVDIWCAGYPCPGESNAGLRRGADDPRWIWTHIARGIRDLRPRLVVLENVRGHVNRGLRIVLADLAALGYVGSWACVRASDIGAPHARDRVNILAWPAGTDPGRWADLAGTRLHQSVSGSNHLTLLPTPSARDGRRGAGWGDLPGRPLSETIHRVADGNWRQYGPAIRHWEQIIGRPAPAPMVPGRTGEPALSDLFVEWMLGFPAGHVSGHVPQTDRRGRRAPHRRRTNAVRLVGNGAAPLQLAHGIRTQLSSLTAGVAA